MADAFSPAYCIGSQTLMGRYPPFDTSPTVESIVRSSKLKGEGPMLMDALGGGLPNGVVSALVVLLPLLRGWP